MKLVTRILAKNADKNNTFEQILHNSRYKFYHYDQIGFRDIFDDIAKRN